MVDVDNVMKMLGKISAFDYFKKRSMPDFAEPLVEELLVSVSSMSTEERNRICFAVNAQAAGVFGWYARKLSGRAIRNGSQDDLWQAALALAIAANNADFRDLFAQVALACNSAKKLGQTPESLFELASSIIESPPAKELFKLFMHLPSNQRSIGSFGFSEGMGPHGFDYIPLLAEYGGPVPF